jgi:hypothetical protein
MKGMATSLGPALAGLLLWLPVACAGEQPTATGRPAMAAAKELPMSDDAPVTGSFDRNPPPAVPALVRNGKRYAQRLGSLDDKAGQAGGLLDIIDDKTGAVEATIKVYDNRRDPKIEGDVQDIFFAAMAFDDAGKLIITDETGRRFAVDVTARTVVAVP